MMNLQDLEWGDVIHQGDGVVVCEAQLDGDEVVVKRWQQGLLDDELVARRLLDGAGLPARELLGWGEGWMVLEQLSQSMWRPADERDRASDRFLEALASWFVSVHALTPDGLAASVEESLLTPAMLGLAAESGGVSAEELARLRDHLAGLLGQGGSLVLGEGSMDSLWLLGDGLRAMSDGLQASHAGHPAEDLLLVTDGLAARGDVFLAAYCRHAGLERQRVEDWIEAARMRAVLVRWVATIASGGRPGPELAAQLQTAIVSCCCR